MTDEEIKTVVDYAHFWLEKGREIYESTDLEKQTTLHAGNVLKLAEELAALKDKMRWRDENVEPAPRGERVLVYCIDYDASDGVHDTEMEHMYCPDGELAYPYTWWRPLDLPEVGANAHARSAERIMVRELERSKASINDALHYTYMVELQLKGLCEQCFASLEEARSISGRCHCKKNDQFCRIYQAQNLILSCTKAIREAAEQIEAQKKERENRE